MIPYGKQVISSQDIDSVISVLKSDFLTQGPVVPHFEKAFAKKSKQSLQWPLIVQPAPYI